MTKDERKASAMEAGRRLAQETVSQRREARARRAAALAAHPARLEFSVQAAGPASVQAVHRQSAGFLVALGDSWFDYPFHDVLKVLDDDYGYDVESAAHRGDRIEAIAYQNGQIDQFARCLQKVKDHGAMPKAVLISGGGNDIVGDDFGMLLNSAGSPIEGWNETILGGIIDERVMTSYYCLITAINGICTQTVGQLLPIIFHGYDYLVPDGRGVLGGWPFPGPWLEPGFHEKGFPDLPTNRVMMRHVIIRLHDMLTVLAGDSSLGHVHYLDLRGTLSNDLTGHAYKASWANELHPTKDGFAAVAKQFADLIAKV